MAMTFQDPRRLVGNLVYDPGLLEWVAMTQPGAVGGSGGAVTVADGADVAQGSTADVAWTSGSGTVIALLKKIASAGGSAVSVADGSSVVEGATTDAVVTTDTTGTLSGKLRGLVKWAFERMPASLGQKAMAASLPVAIASDQALPLPSGAATGAKQDTGNTSLASIDGKLTAPLTVSGPLTDTQLRASAVPVSLTSTPLPSNAATETGGNLATIAAKDFATQTTLALIKAKTDNLDAASSTLATASAQSTGNTSLGSIKTNTDPLVAAGAGGYVRQDSTATIAKESGGNLATIAANSALAATAALQTTGNASVATTATNTGTGATGLGKLEDTASADGDAGVAVLAVRQDIPGADVSAQGDYAFAKTDAQGRLWVNSDVLCARLDRMNDLLGLLVVETRLQTEHLAHGLNVPEALHLRDDLAVTLQ